MLRCAERKKKGCDGGAFRHTDNKMRIAVTYENGNIFQHFGHAEAFKVYEIENGEVVAARIVESDGAGHDALAGFLADQEIQVLICGGIGSGAQAALAENGILLYPGIEGSCDAAVDAFLAGALEQGGANCDHHHDDEEGGCHCGGDEGGCHCSGGCGGCHAPAFEGPNVGKQVSVHYRGTFDDGSQFDSSYDRGETLDFVCGAGMMILGFDKAVATMEVGQEIDIHLMPEEAYGPKNPNAIFTLNIADLPGSESLVQDQKVYLRNSMGQPFPCVVAEKTATTITFDANHEMAGKELNFHIQLVSIAE